MITTVEPVQPLEGTGVNEVDILLLLLSRMEYSYTIFNLLYYVHFVNRVVIVCLSF